MKPIFALVLTAALFFACEPVTNPTPPPPVPVLDYDITSTDPSTIYNGDNTISTDALPENYNSVGLVFTNNSNDTLVIKVNGPGYTPEILAKGESSTKTYWLNYISLGALTVTPRNAYGDGTTVTLSIKP